MASEVAANMQEQNCQPSKSQLHHIPLSSDNDLASFQRSRSGIPKPNDPGWHYLGYSGLTYGRSPVFRGAHHGSPGPRYWRDWVQVRGLGERRQSSQPPQNPSTVSFPKPPPLHSKIDQSLYSALIKIRMAVFTSNALAKPRADLICRFCSRHFAKKDHLNRHERIRKLHTGISVSRCAHPD